MKSKVSPKRFAMVAACALVANVATLGAAHAQGMPADAQQLVQTMRPMFMSQATPEQKQTAATPAAQTDDAAYGGMAAGVSASASGRAQSGCRAMPRCDVFFGQ
ncbi:hypothetical protein NOV72_02704 [Caballeronia novacaledonica]|uniref:Uncharacterized protein n=1 Tax=Caballeronia novacaledonica TaxID=1544861 RepID=A0A2U3I5V0_9BURK|nr:hypothetical protein [Caballeronia novacaledonica]SPB15484.1 hypothetical protein NOV72_02704 [Caballeronia novacaledonica]